SGSEEGFQRALELSQSSRDVHEWYAFYLTQMGRFDEAIAETKRGMELDPFNPLMSASLGWTYFVARRYDEAIGHLKKVVELAPDLAMTHIWLSWSYLMTELYGEAIDEAEQAFSLDPNPITIAFLAYAYGASGRRDEALNLLDSLLALSTQLWLDPIIVAFAYMGIGENDQSLEWLEKGYKERSPMLVHLRLFPPADHLRADHRFQDLMRRMNYPE
ncbi:MAG: tetratricopeptide repeat protein, partial [Fidelibacterota bacterium]